MIGGTQQQQQPPQREHVPWVVGYLTGRAGGVVHGGCGIHDHCCKVVGLATL